MIVASRKIGKNRGKPRLWIEGKLLFEAGFKHGDRWDLVSTTSETLLITKFSEGERKISGSSTRPVIDISGSTLGDLGAEPKVSLNYIPNEGLIRVGKIK